MLLMNKSSFENLEYPQFVIYLFKCLLKINFINYFIFNHFLYLYNYLKKKHHHKTTKNNYNILLLLLKY